MGRRGAEIGLDLRSTSLMFSLRQAFGKCKGGLVLLIFIGSFAGVFVRSAARDDILRQFRYYLRPLASSCSTRFLKSADSVTSMTAPLPILRVHGAITRSTVEGAVGYVEISKEGHAEPTDPP